MGMPNAFDFIYRPDYHLVLLAFVGAATFEALVAAWAATSQRHWFLRALTVWAAVMLVLPTRAWDPALVFAIASPLIVVIVKVYRWMAIASSRQVGINRIAELRFTVSDLLLLLLISGMVLGGTLQARQLKPPFPPWSQDAWLMAAAIALPAATAFCTVAGPRRDLGAVLFVVFFAAAVIGVPVLRGEHPGVVEFGITYSAESIVADMTLVAVILAEVVLAIVLFTAIANTTFARSPTTRPGAWCRGLAAIVTLSLIPLVLLYVQLVRLRQFPPPVICNFSHFARIAEIGDRLNPFAFEQLSDEDSAKLGAEAQSHLQESNGLPFDPARVREDVSRDSTIGCISLGWWLNDQTRISIDAGDLDRAAEFALANSRLGTLWRRGGIGVHDKLGESCDQQSWSDLARIRNRLSSSRIRQTSEQILRDLAEREPSAIIDARERAAWDSGKNWQWRSHEFIDETLGNVLVKRQYDGRDTFRPLHFLLLVEMAICLFEREQSRIPESLSELVPKYLPEIPNDPLTSRPFVYRTHQSAMENKFVLYSVGWDRKDDGGNFGNWDAYQRSAFHSNPGYDLDLDTLIRH